MSVTSLGFVTGRRTVAEVLADAQRLGTLGDRPIDEVIEHAQQFLAGLEGVTGTVVDIGTGAGVPGLVLAEARPDLTFVLVDRRQTRIDALSRGVTACGLVDRVTVIAGDTATISRDQRFAGRCAAVVSRGFGRPPETLDAARPFLSVGGRLVVSEPPEPDPERWPEAAREALGFGKPLYFKGIVMFHVEQSRL